MTTAATHDSWVEWLDAHAAWRRAVADLVHGRTTSLRPAPKPPAGDPPADDAVIALRVAAAGAELAKLRKQASYRMNGELHATLAYRTSGL